MKPIPTAEELFRHKFPYICDLIDQEGILQDVAGFIVEFAQMHTKAALEVAAENAEVTEGWNTGFSGSAASVDKDSIINAYPLTNVK